MDIKDLPIYSETQKFRAVWWVMLLVLGVASLMWWGFIQQIILGEPWGNIPAPDWMMWLLLLAVGIGLPLLFWFMGLVVEVRSDKLLIRYVPFHRRPIPWDDINGAAVQTYQPIRQFGGWGIRGFGDRRAYSVKGDRGVEITLKQGQSILIGSQNPEELALAIEAQLSSR